VKQLKTEEDREKLGLAPKKAFNIQDKLRALKAKDADKEEEKVIDPYTVKVRKFHSEMNENDLREIMEVYGYISRCRVPMDQDYPTLNKGIGFVTYAKAEDAKKVLAEGSIVYESYELPVEAAFDSPGMAERHRNGGGGGGGDWQERGGDRGGFRGRGDGERGGFRGRDGESRGGFRGRDGEGRGGRGGYGDREGGGGYRGGYGGDREGGSRGGYGESKPDEGSGWGRRAN